MSSCKTDAEGGLNAFVDAQKNEPGEALLTLVHFNTSYEFVHKGVPIKDVPKYTLQPHGNTALLDAVGRAIIETGERLAAMSEDQRPALVVFVILTDGQENSSREFSREKIKEMITHQTDAYKWQFTFLGANQDAFAEAGAMGIATSGTANFARNASPQAFKSAHKNVTRMRTASAQGVTVENRYTDAERKEMTDTP